MTDDRGARIAHLCEALAALDGYGNGDGRRAAAVRAELAELEAESAELVDELPAAPAPVDVDQAAAAAPRRRTRRRGSGG